mmetsp:Transcript_63794/g.167049  ORF Transcript_63794/g.167049 Transcript_63794/m.167049 type:complete len:559 (-) Transcript_63794:434-2110(-)
MQGGHDRLHHEGPEERRPVVRQEGRRDLAGAPHVRLQPLQGRGRVLHQGLRHEALLPLRALCGKLRQLDLALRQPALQLGELGGHGGPQRLREALGLLDALREVLPGVRHGRLRVLLGLRNLLAHGAGLLGGHLVHLVVAELAHGVGQLLDRGLHARYLLARGLHLALELPLRGVLLELIEPGCEAVQLLLAGQQLLRAGLRGPVREGLGVPELLDDEGPRLRDGLLRLVRRRVAGGDGPEGLARGQRLDTLEERELLLRAALDRPVRLLHVLDGRGDQVRRLQPFSLLLRRGHHLVELPIGRRALGPHGRELLLQDALGGLEFDLHQLGRGAELGLARDHALVQALHALGGRRLAALRHHVGRHLVHLALRGPQAIHDLGEHLLHPEALLRVLRGVAQLDDVLLHAVHPRLQPAELAARARARHRQLLQLGRALQEVLPSGHDARLRRALGQARLLHRLLRALRDGVARGANVGERLRRLHHLLHLRLGRRDLVLHVLEEVRALPVRRARPELLQPLAPVLHALLQRVDLLLHRLRRALREARHLDHLLGDEGLRLR